jgi:hypothetical protein
MKNFKGYLLFVLLTSAIVQMTVQPIAWSQLVNPVKDSTIQFSDITTNNASSTKHGFLPKLDNTGTKYLRDDGTWQTVSSAGGGGFSSIGTINSLVKSASGASSTGTSLVMQTADVTNPGLISVGTQTMSGDKTINLISSTFTGGTISGAVEYNPTISGSVIVISGTGTIGGYFTNAGTISGGIVSGTKTLGGTTTHVGVITGGAVSGSVIYNPTVSGSVIVVSGTTALGGIINNNGIFQSGMVSQTTISGTTSFNGRLNFNNSMIPVSGTGIDFSLGQVSPTTASTTTVTKILKNFAEGTCTPSFKGATSDGTTVYVQQHCYWNKVASKVCVNVRLGITSNTGGGGQLSVSGMPFVVGVSSTYGQGGISVNGKGSWTTNGPDYGTANPGTHAIQLFADGNTGNTTLTPANTGASTSVGLHGCYFTNE